MTPCWVTVTADHPAADGTWPCVDNGGRALRVDAATLDHRLLRLRRGQRLRGVRRHDLVLDATL